MHEKESGIENPARTRFPPYLRCLWVKPSPVLFVPMALAFGILSGVRWPNIWSATHILFDYSEGFTKRGLFGEILSVVLGETIAYQTIATISFCTAAAWLVLLFIFVKRLSRKDRDLWIVVAVFLISPGFVFLVHEVGYFDHLGLIVVLLCFMMPPTLAGLAGRVALTGLAILVYEAFFLTFFPAVVMQFWLGYAPRGAKATIPAVACLVLVVAGLTYAMGQAKIPQHRQDAYVEHIESRAADFEIRRDAVAVQFHDGQDNLAIMAGYWSQPGRWITALLGIIILLPFPVILTLIALTAFGHTEKPPDHRRFLIAGIVTASFSPLLLNIFAWDLWRFFALTQTSAFLVLIAVASNPSASPPRSAWAASTYLFAALAILGAATSIPLFDGFEVAKPPYLDQLNYFLNVLLGKAPAMVIPSQ